MSWMKFHAIFFLCLLFYRITNTKKRDIWNNFKLNPHNITWREIITNKKTRKKNMVFNVIIHCCHTYDCDCVRQKIHQSSSSLGLKSVVCSVHWCVEGEAHKKYYCTFFVVLFHTIWKPQKKRIINKFKTFKLQIYELNSNWMFAQLMCTWINFFCSF